MIPATPQLCKVFGLDPETTGQIAIDAEDGALIVRAWQTDDAGLINVTVHAYRVERED